MVVHGLGLMPVIERKMWEEEKVGCHGQGSCNAYKYDYDINYKVESNAKATVPRGLVPHSPLTAGAERRALNTLAMIPSYPVHASCSIDNADGVVAMSTRVQGTHHTINALAQCLMTCSPNLWASKRLTSLETIIACEFLTRSKNANSFFNGRVFSHFTILCCSGVKIGC